MKKISRARPNDLGSQAFDGAHRAFATLRPGLSTQSSNYRQIKKATFMVAFKSMLQYYSCVWNFGSRAIASSFAVTTSSTS